MLESLAQLAAKEEWNTRSADAEQQQYQHPILYSYVQHTFKRLREEYDAASDQMVKQSKIAICEDKACFNTGLYTENYEQIYGLFSKNRNPGLQPWYMVGFFRESDLELNSFVPLPTRAEYFQNISDLVFDYRLEIRINSDHILNDANNVSRLPEMFRDPSRRGLLINVFGGAVNVAKKRVATNYKLAIPQFYEGKVQLLIPLCLAGDEPDAALVIYREGAIYQGRTCLTIDQAYNNARLIAKPESNWLKPLQRDGALACK